MLRRKGRDVTLDSSKGSGGWRGLDAGWSILMQHQHKHTEDKERREMGRWGLLYKAS